MGGNFDASFVKLLIKQDALDVYLLLILHHLILATAAGAEVRAARLDAFGGRFENADELAVGRDFDELFAEDEGKLDFVLWAVGCEATVERQVQTDYFVFAHACPM